LGVACVAVIAQLGVVKAVCFHGTSEANRVTGEMHQTDLPRVAPDEPRNPRVHAPAGLDIVPVGGEHRTDVLKLVCNHRKFPRQGVEVGRAQRPARRIVGVDRFVLHQGQVAIMARQPVANPLRSGAPRDRKKLIVALMCAPSARVFDCARDVDGEAFQAVIGGRKKCAAVVFPLRGHGKEMRAQPAWLQGGGTAP